MRGPSSYLRRVVMLRRRIDREQHDHPIALPERAVRSRAASQPRMQIAFIHRVPTVEAPRYIQAACVLDGNGELCSRV